MIKIRRPRSMQPIPPHAQVVFSGALFDLYQWEQEMFDGSTEIFEKVKRHHDTVNIIPVTEDGKILIAEEQQPCTDPFIALIGGRVDPGEDPIDTARRELREEAGYEADELIIWNAYQPAGSKIDWAVYNFIAKRCRKVGEQILDPGERISIREVDFEDFWKAMLDERFRSHDVELMLLRMTQTPGELEEFKDLLFN